LFQEQTGVPAGRICAKVFSDRIFFVHCIICSLTNKKEKFILTGNCFRGKQVFQMAEFVQKYLQAEYFLCIASFIP